MTFKRHKKGETGREKKKQYAPTAKCSKKFVEICDETRSILAVSRNAKNQGMKKKNQNKTKAAELLGVLFALQFCPRRRPAAHFMAIAIPAALA